MAADETKRNADAARDAVFERLIGLLEIVTAGDVDMLLEMRQEEANPEVIAVLESLIAKARA